MGLATQLEQFFAPARDVLSLSMAFLAAFPVNTLLVEFGVKEGMKTPPR